jgi:hypothetical protein
LGSEMPLRRMGELSTASFPQSRNIAYGGVRTFLVLRHEHGIKVNSGCS